MRKLYVTACLAIGSLALVACSLIPAQSVGDPLGLDFQDFVITMGGSNLSTQAVSTQAISIQAIGTSTVTGGFGDIDSPLSPATFDIDQPLAANATVAVTSGTLPGSIELSDLVLELSISDTMGEATFNLEPSATATLTQQNGSSYSVSNVTFSGKLSGAMLSQLNPIITGGGFNSVVATLRVSSASSPDLPAGSTISLSFGEGTGSVSF